MSRRSNRNLLLLLLPPPSADVSRAPDHQHGGSQRAHSHRELVQEEEGVQGTRPHRGALQVPR